jgi:signal transduction histidine kinase
MEINDLEYTIVFTTLTILLFIAGAVITVFIASRQRSRQEIVLSQARLAYESELRTIEAEVQETTLSHIASELHDNVGQLLAVLSMQLEKEKIYQPALGPTLAPAFETLQATIQQVRLLSHSLSHELIAEAELSQVITQEVERLRGASRYKIEFSTDDVEPDISKDSRIVVFRIFQEAITNVLRHSKASSLWISLCAEPTFALKIRDNGSGFDKDAVLASSGGLGLKNMFRRAALANLHCELDTAPGNGCTLTITSS